MSRLLMTAFILMLSEVGGAAHAQSDGAWQTMALSDFREPSQTDPLQTMVWPDAIRDANAYATRELKKNLNGKNAWVTALSTRFEDKGRSIIISTVLTRACESGANHAGAGVERSICPLRLVVHRNGISNIREATGCFAVSNPIEGTGNFASYDVETRTIRLGTLLRHDAVEGCSKNIPVTEAR